jgi:hypothetical protein
MKWFPRSRASRDRAAILDLLRGLVTKVDGLMAGESDLKNDLDTIQTNLGAIATRLSDQASAITALQQQLAAGTPVSQSQLDALKAEADSIVTASMALLPAPTGSASAPSGTTGT